MSSSGVIHVLDVMPGLIAPSCAGLTRASIEKNISLKRMDCRVKPGNDGGRVSANQHEAALAHLTPSRRR
jgi:hypothetical protein